MLTNEYLKRVYAEVEKRDGHEPEFLQAVREVFESLELVIDKHPEWEKASTAGPSMRQLRLNCWLKRRRQ